jgi:hypothetical protein
LSVQKASDLLVAGVLKKAHRLCGTSAAGREHRMGTLSNRSLFPFKPQKLTIDLELVYDAHQAGAKQRKSRTSYE